MLRMPTKTQVREGPHRAFVEELFMYYREAGRPPLRTISDWIKNNADAKDLTGTASTETIRRVLTGITIPRNWPTVETILEALCSIAGRSPNEDRWDDNGYRNYEPWPIRAEVKKLWNAMLDDYQQDEQMPTLPPRRIPQPSLPSSNSNFEDPWATAPTPARSGPTSFDDEPPF
jgi:hypothetical protein